MLKDLTPSPTDHKEKTKETGIEGEKFVCDKMIAGGFTILARNVTEKFAEIDIVAQENGCLCFVEVRTRENTRLGHPLETITPKKQATVRRAAEAYLARRRIVDREIRFDVATVVWSTMEFTYLRNAF